MERKNPILLSREAREIVHMYDSDDSHILPPHGTFGVTPKHEAMYNDDKQELPSKIVINGVIFNVNNLLGKVFF